MIATDSQINNLISEGLSGEPALRRDKADFDPAFWDLRTGLLGSLAQKLVNYGLSLTLTGDFAAEVERSRALRDFFRESQRSGPIRLAAAAGSA